jgi:prepilin-type N-terminal cleavage/methylation domain-containing protein
MALRRGFSLIELLVVIAIIGLLAVAGVSLFGLLSHRQVGEGARLLQATLAGARDAAARNNVPSGIRLLPDPTFNGIDPATGLLDKRFPLAYNRIIPIGPAPNYSEGAISVFPNDVYPAAIQTVNGVAGVPCLVIEQCPGHWIQPVPAQPYIWAPNTPTSWFWNIRVGDKIQVGNTGNWYTVVGPTTILAPAGNPELYVNVGLPGTPTPLSRQITSPDLQIMLVQPEFLLLTNGRDDNANGWIDEGFDGVDNDGNGTIDDLAEWELERWLLP